MPVKVVTVVGTRPEIIRLSRVMALLDQSFDHVLVHTGQNYDYELNEIFFDDLDIRRPDHYLNAVGESLGATLGEIIRATEAVLAREQPDAMLVLGDTNSCFAAVIARRMRIPVYHMEAGNRCFDENVPEEVNRRIVDHTADYNLVYTEFARRNLLAEGVHPTRIGLTGSPMREVLDHYGPAIERSSALEQLGVEEGGYFLASIHREETVDEPERLAGALRALRTLAEEHGVPVLLSTHPRTRQRLESRPAWSLDGVRLHKPFSFTDYVRLQKSARAVLSDSGTISEESAMLGFPAVTLRDSTERPEALETGGMVTTGLEHDSIVGMVDAAVEQHRLFGTPPAPSEYSVHDTSRRVAAFMAATVHSHHERAGIRRVPRRWVNS